MSENQDTSFNTIREQLAQAKQHLALLHTELQRLEQAGMYGSIPRVIWVKRNGNEKVYLMLHFPINSRTGDYDSPNGKKKNYVGCKPAKIKAARVLMVRRRRYNVLGQSARNVELWISARERSLQNLARECGYWKRAAPRLLGPDPDQVIVEFDPKVEGTSACP